ncbi:LFA3 protein, partial [Alcedo cyanopectus]|nr:LFA3 protein [Ceyx cyanopectus]
VAHIHSMEVFGILGENFTFPVNTGYKMDEIIWTKNKDKVVEWEGLTKPTYFTPFQKRGLLNTENGCLTIYNLEKSDAGIYVLEYLRSMENSIFHSLAFVLAVLDPPSEPEISCNMSSDGLALKCTADFQKPLTYFWKVKSTEDTYPKQEISIPKEKVDASDKVACFIKFYQMEKSSEISLSQCLP